MSRAVLKISKIPWPADATAAALAGYSRENPVEAVFRLAQISTAEERFDAGGSIMF
jgi:hypothetical protein